jgi:signal transduction histidine kinase
MCRRSRNGHGGLVSGGERWDTWRTVTRTPPPPYAGDIAGYRTFVAIVSVNYFTLLVLTPRAWGAEPAPLWLLASLGALYLALGIWGFGFAQRVGRVVVSLTYLLVEFGIGMWINELAPGGLLPLILLPLAAQAVALLPRLWAFAMCLLVIAGVSGNLSWVPSWPAWFRNLASATAAVVFVVVYVGVAAREREARYRVEKLSAEVAQLAAANERNRLAREIHDTLGHYLTVIHVQLEAAKAIVRTDQDRGLLAVNRAQALARDGLAAVRQSVKALREDGRVEGLAEQLASLADAVRDETFAATFAASGTPRPVSAAVALALHRTALEALTNVRRHAQAAHVDIALAFRPDGRVQLRVHDDGRGAERLDGGYGLAGIRERAEQLGGTVGYHTGAGQGFTLDLELPG